MEDDQKKDKTEKGFSTWVELFIRKGRKTRIFLWIFLIIFSGFGYLFINQSNDMKYFNKKLNFSQNLISAFYSQNPNLFFIEAGKEAEAEKHGILIPAFKIQEYLQKMEMFQKNNKFSPELLKEFITKHKISQYDVWKYAEQKFKNEILLNVLNINSNDVKILDSILDNQISNSKIEGVQYYLKDDYINENIPKINWLDRENLKSFKEFVFIEFQNSSHFSLEPELRSGFLLKFKSRPDKSVLDFVLENKLTRKNAILKLKKINIEAELLEINKAGMNIEISDLLFEDINIFERNNNFFIPIVEEIMPQKMVSISQQMDKLKEQYEYIMFQKNSFILANKLQNDFNNGLIDENFLEKICIKKKFVKTKNNLFFSNFKIFSLKEGESLAIMNYESKPIIIICKKRYKTHAENSDIMHMIMQNQIKQNSTFLFNIAFIQYWKSHFDRS